MTDVKHTPGPWGVVPNTFEAAGSDPRVQPFTVESREWCIAEVYGDVPELKTQAEANAHLIAAAPTLLAAAKYARDTLLAADPVDRTSDEEKAIKGLAAAIALARGEN